MNILILEDIFNHNATVAQIRREGKNATLIILYSENTLENMCIHE